MRYPSIVHDGAVTGVTGSCHQLQVDDKHPLLIDCGLFQGAETSSAGRAGAGSLAPDFSLGGTTHAHVGRVGRIAYRLQSGFKDSISCSESEVYGDLEGPEDLFNETTPYAPSSPYSASKASKASSDHLVRAWRRTYGLPTLVTNCSNNYGPYHFPEKLIPLVILNALEGKMLPVYGKGDQVSDWLYVEDHARALYKVVTEGRVGETYNIGGHNEKQNLEVVHTLYDLLDELRPREDRSSYRSLITHVQDRPGHDLRYSIDASKIQRALGWTPKETFESGIRKTVEWYLDNLDWCRRVQDGSYQRERLGSTAQGTASI